MSWTRVPIVNCKKALIRRAPWIPLRDEEIIGIRDGPKQKENSVKFGDYIEIDTEKVCYNWTDRKFYKVRNPDGWIYEGCVEVGDDSNGG